MPGQYAFEHGDKVIISIDGAAGTGKTTVGKIIANEINYQFLDLAIMYWSKYYKENSYYHLNYFLAHSINIFVLSINYYSISWYF